jgi:dihydroorotate dehydrogenase subfamily 1
MMWAMGWYAAAGRPLLFSLPPEAAHRAAIGLLGLPLPWRRLGGAVEDPALATTLAELQLRNPIGLAAGFDKGCTRLGELGSIGFGYVVGGTITREAREGNASPRVVRSPADASMVNAMGLPNPGADAVADHLAGAPGEPPCPRFISVADQDVDDAAETAARLAPHADALELNASCPNVAWGRDRDTEAHVRELLTAFAERTGRPVFVKLPPFVTRGEEEAVVALARVAQEAGAAGLTCSNTRPVADRRLSAGRGGLSGRALWPHTLEIVSAVREATGGSLPVNACGGIRDAEDVLACLEAGAATVQIYTSMIYEGPGIIGNLTRGLAALLRARGQTVQDLS